MMAAGIIFVDLLGIPDSSQPQQGGCVFYNSRQMSVRKLKLYIMAMKLNNFQEPINRRYLSGLSFPEFSL